MYFTDKTDHSLSGDILLNEVKELVNITVSQDASWTRRGRAMNSLSGILIILAIELKSV